MTAPRRRLLGAALLAVLAAAAALAAAVGVGAFSGPTPAQIAAEKIARLRAAEQRAVGNAESLVAVRLPRRSGSPAPDPPPTLFRPPLPGPHQVVGYVPYWTMADLTPADYTDVSTLAYYGPALLASGRLDTTGPGYADLSSGALTQLVSRSHAAGDRVLLTAATTDPTVIAGLLADPAGSAARLAGDLLPLVAAHHFDGISLDVEGRATAQRHAYTTFVADLSARLRRADPHLELVVDVYPQSAGNGSDFFDVAALAPHVDLLFVMAYDMEDPTQPSAGAPLASPTLGLSDVQTVLAYEKAVPASKLVLGVPFYGYDFTLAAGRSASRPSAAGPPVAVTYAAIAAVGRPARWDTGSYTPYTSFVEGGRAHETFYDDAVSIALKTALAEKAGLAGTGAWALGDEGNDAHLLQALDGGSPPVRLPPVPGPSTAAVAAAVAAATAAGTAGTAAGTTPAG